MTPDQPQSSQHGSTALAECSLASASGTLSDSNHNPEAPMWEVLYSCLGSLEHRELVDHARRQGLLYGVGFPKITADNGDAAPSPVPARLQFIKGLLQGNRKRLKPAPTDMPTTFWDDNLSASAQAAVGKAVSSPDICLLQGTDRAVTDRVAAEIITQATARGLRVLFLAGHPKGLDRVLDLLTGREPVFALRCLDVSESLNKLSAAARAATFRERSRILRERAWESAHNADVQVKQRLASHSAEEKIWHKLNKLAKRRAEIEKKLTHSHVAIIEREQHKCHRELEDVTTEMEPLRSLAEAQRQGRWWSPKWWSAKFQKDKLVRYEKLAGREKSLNANLTSLADRLAALQIPGDAEPNQMHDVPLANGQIQDKDIESLEKELADLEAQGETLLQEIEAEELHCKDFSEQAVEESRCHWEERCEAEKEKARFLARWLEYLEEFSDVLAARLPRLANVVAGTLKSLAGDPHFGKSSDDHEFDVLLVDEAHRLSENDLLQLSRRTARWILLGDAHAKAVTGTSAADRGGRKPRGHPHKNRQTHEPVKTNWFTCLCRLLHCDPSTSPYAWSREENRLCCRLRDLTREQRKYLENETVADQPDIELRILNQPNEEPVLAEVVFPEAMTLSAAKEYIFHELEEVPLQAGVHNLCWLENDERVILELVDHVVDETTSVGLETGLWEHYIVPHSQKTNLRHLKCHAVRLEFERAHGWDLERASAWVQERLGWLELGRSVVL